MEQVKQMLSRAKYGWSDVSDPVVALQRDSEIVKDVESGDAAIRGIYGNQLTQLEHLISTQRVSQQQMRDQLVAVERQYHRVSYLYCFLQLRLDRFVLFVRKAGNICILL
jgi:Cortactin-binding protein-2